MTQKKAGRPSKFTEKLAQRIFELAQSGATDPQIAKAVGVSRSTLNNWKGSHKGFLDALKASKDVADQLVEASLFARAVGYSHPAVKILYDSEAGQFVTKRYTEHYPPDTVACIFWLKNRKRKRWTDTQIRQHKGSLTLETLVGGEDEDEPA